MALSKPKLLQTLLSLMPLFLMLVNKVHSQETTTFTIDRFISNPPNLIYQGDARVLPDSTVLSLAGRDSSGNKKNASVGRVLYSTPVQFWERSSARQSTFQTTIIFTIKPSTNGAADGIALFFAPVGTTFPDGYIGGSLGIYTGLTNPSIFAVEFDTSYNPLGPTYHHIGINIESRVSSNVTRFDPEIEREVITRISYNSNTKTISVVAFSGYQRATLSHVFDLKTILPERVQVGIASSTGRDISAVGLPEIQSWYFTSTLVSDTTNVDDNKYEEAYIKQYV